MADETEMELDELKDPAEMQAPEADLPVPTDAAQTDAAEADEEESERYAADLEAVFDVPVNVSAILGKTHMEVSQLLKLGRGAVVELDRKVGEAIDIYVNNRLVARGEVVVVDERLGVTMTEIIKGGNAA